MNKNIIFLFLFSILLLDSPLSNASYQPESQTIKKRAWQFQADLSMFSTTGYYSVDSELFAMDEEDDFQKTDIDFTVRYGYGDQLELRSGLRVRQNTSVAGPNEVTNSGLESFMLGAKYKLFPRSKSPWKFSLDAYLRNTLYTNDAYTDQNPPADELVLGDSGTSFLFGAHASYYPKSKNFILSGSGLFHRPPNNLSPEFVYSLDIFFPFGRLALGAGVEGVLSFGQDEYSSDPSQKPKQATGMSLLFNSTNRAWNVPFVKGVYSFDRFQLYLKAGIVASGTSTDEGNHLAAGLTWDFGGVDPNQEKINSFKEYTIEASVLQVSPKGKFVKIDKGIAQDVQKGQRFDIYETDYFGGNKLIATGRVFKVASDAAIIKLERMIANKTVKPGFSARAQ